MYFLFHIDNQFYTTQIQNLVCTNFPDAKIQTVEKFKTENHLSNNEKIFIFIDDNNFSNFLSAIELNVIVKKNIHLIMVSKSPKHGIECIRHGFYDYLLANTLKEDFELFSGRLTNQFFLDSTSNINNHILIKDHKSETKLKYNDILFIEASGSYSTLYTNNKFFTVAKTIKMLIPNFPETFVRVHRSFAINLFHIKSYNSEEVVMNNETRIKISRTKKMALIEAIRKSA